MTPADRGVLLNDLHVVAGLRVRNAFGEEVGVGGLGLRAPESDPARARVVGGEHGRDIAGVVAEQVGQVAHAEADVDFGPAECTGSDGPQALTAAEEAAGARHGLRETDRTFGAGGARVEE